MHPYRPNNRWPMSWRTEKDISKSKYAHWWPYEHIRQDEPMQIDEDMSLDEQMKSIKLMNWGISRNLVKSSW